MSDQLDVPLVQAAQNVVPVVATAVESIERLRTWVSGRCLSALQLELSQTKPTQTGAGSRRKVNRDSSMNWNETAGIRLIEEAETLVTDRPSINSASVIPSA